MERSKGREYNAEATVRPVSVLNAGRNDYKIMRRKVVLFAINYDLSATFSVVNQFPEIMRVIANIDLVDHKCIYCCYITHVLYHL